jgi:hypothetical protein
MNSNLNKTQKKRILKLIKLNFIKRRIPYPPNFKRIAAKIIEPKTGASTCAFGNQE